MLSNRRDRIRPSSIQLLPPEADQAVANALHAVITRKSTTQANALGMLNKALALLDLDPVALSTFNRLVVQFRNEGIPQRYRLANTDIGHGASALLDLIDERISVALARRVGR